MRISDWSSDVCSSDLGSADAAAVLRALARLTQVSPDDPRLAACAVELGADVPACLFGRAALGTGRGEQLAPRSEEHTSELQSLMRISYAVFCLKKKTQTT